MRICHFITSSVDNHYFENHARAASERRVCAFLVTLTAQKDPDWLAAVPGVRHRSLAVTRRSAYPLAVLRLAAFLRRERIDVLQVHLFDATAVGVTAARLARTPLVVATRHHLDDAILAGARMHVRIDKLMGQLADCIVAPSAAVQRHLVEQEGHPPEKVELIHHGWNYDRLSTTPADGARVRQELHIGPQEFVVGTVARFSPNKGHGYLLPALERIARVIPNLRVLLVGEGDSTGVRGEARRRGLDAMVTITGWRADVPACMRAMDVLVHPSLSEAFCQVIIEGMAAGLPLVATDVGGTREAITDGHSGFLVPPRDSGAIVERVVQLHRDRALRVGMGEEAARTVRARFRAEQMTTAQYDLYHRWLGASAGGRRRPSTLPVAG